MERRMAAHQPCAVCICLSDRVCCDCAVWGTSAVGRTCLCSFSKVQCLTACVFRPDSTRVRLLQSLNRQRQLVAYLRGETLVDRQAALDHFIVFQRLARSQGHTGHGVVGDVAGHPRLFGKQSVEIAQQRASAAHDDAAIDHV
jgi:hypothetical protein